MKIQKGMFVIQNYNNIRSSLIIFEINFVNIIMADDKRMVTIAWPFEREIP